MMIVDVGMTLRSHLVGQISGRYGEKLWAYVLHGLNMKDFMTYGAGCPVHPFFFVSLLRKFGLWNKHKSKHEGIRVCVA